MEQKHLDEVDNSYFGEETIDEDYPILKVEKKEKKEEKREEKKASAPVAKPAKVAPASVKKKEPEIIHQEDLEEVQIKPARVETHKEPVREPVKEVKSEPTPVAVSIETPKVEEPKSEEPSSGSPWWKWLIFALIILAIAAFYTNGFGYYNNNPEAIILVPEPVAEIPEDNSSIKPELSIPVTTEKGTELTLLAKRWMFDPNTLYANAGENIHLTIKSTDLDFVFSIHGLEVQQAVSGITLVDFTPSVPGTYTFTCSSCDSWRGMEGQLIVK